jgi:hypothetical protein
MANVNQILKQIKKSLAEFNHKKAIESSENEAQTRTYLVEPFFNMLGYSIGYGDRNLIPEYSADFANLKGKKVDYAIQFNKKPEVIIEVKKATVNLNDLHLRQLNEYFINTTESKIGILTNGIQFLFYCRKNSGGPSLHPTPFLSVDLESIEGDTLDKLCKFHFAAIDIKAILSDAQDLFFLESFDEALFKELSNPSKDFVKAIYTRMGGTTLTKNAEAQVRELINSLSIRSALEKLIVEEAKNRTSGVITTEQELNIYHVIKTILAQHKLISSQSISYRDQRTKFSIILDNSIQKKICDLHITPNSQKIEINGDKYDIPDIDSIIALKKRLLDQALSLIA